MRRLQGCCKLKVRSSWSAGRVRCMGCSGSGGSDCASVLKAWRRVLYKSSLLPLSVGFGACPRIERRGAVDAQLQAVCPELGTSINDATAIGAPYSVVEITAVVGFRELDPFRHRCRSHPHQMTKICRNDYRNLDQDSFLSNQSVSHIREDQSSKHTCPPWRKRSLPAMRTRVAKASGSYRAGPLRTATCPSRRLPVLDLASKRA